MIVNLIINQFYLLENNSLRKFDTDKDAVPTPGNSIRSLLLKLFLFVSSRPSEYFQQFLNGNYGSIIEIFFSTKISFIEFSNIYLLSTLFTIKSQSDLMRLINFMFFSIFLKMHCTRLHLDFKIWNKKKHNLIMPYFIYLMQKSNSWVFEGKYVLIDR